MPRAESPVSRVAHPVARMLVGLVLTPHLAGRTRADLSLPRASRTPSRLGQSALLYILSKVLSNLLTGRTDRLHFRTLAPSHRVQVGVHLEPHVLTREYLPSSCMHTQARTPRMHTCIHCIYITTCVR